MSCRERFIEDGRVVERDCHSGAPAEQPAPAEGPGTELRNLLRDWLGITSSPGCSCNAMARKMNRMGADWADGPGMPEILAVMRTEHDRRRKAGKTLIPWTDTGAAMLVRLACRRARRIQA